MIPKLLLILFSLLFGWQNPDVPGDSHKKDKSEDFQKNILLGEFNRKDLEQKPFSRWFKRGYKNYKPEKKALKTIRKNISDYEIVFYMGTWCIDSRREIPKFYKILDEAGYDTNRISSYGVDFYKKTPEKRSKELQIKMVPTIIFYKDGKEVNRFVEFPVKTLAEDIADIVSSQDYKNSYAVF